MGGEHIDKDNHKYRITALQQVIPASVGALTTSLVVTPLDVVKVRLQAQTKTAGRLPGKLDGTWDALIKIIRNEGILSLWSGLGPTLVLAVPSTVVYFVTYEQLRSRLNDCYGQPGVQPSWIPLVSGCTARLYASMFVAPLETIRTNMQVKKQSYLELRESLRLVGYKGLWNGVEATLCRDVPFSGIYWMTYEYLRSKRQSAEVTFWFSFLSGSVAGALSAVLTAPFDVAKTHQQTDISEVSKTSLYLVLKGIYLRNGLPGLFAGIVPRVVKIAPACAIMISIFEYGKQFFQSYNMADLNGSVV